MESLLVTACLLTLAAAPAPPESAAPSTIAIDLGALDRPTFGRLESAGIYQALVLRLVGESVARYVRHPYRYYPLMTGVGTFVTPDLNPSAQPTTQYQGYALPAFVRFLQLREIEGKLADCAGSTVTSPSAACQLLLRGTVPQ